MKRLAIALVVGFAVIGCSHNNQPAQDTVTAPAVTQTQTPTKTETTTAPSQTVVVQPTDTVTVPSQTVTQTVPPK